MKSKKTTKKTVGSKKFPWRRNQRCWTDTFYDKKLLQNPFRMTSNELANALAEHQRWRLGNEKYKWDKDPIKENKEQEPPFSPSILTGLLYEAIVRLCIVGDMNCGRFKTDVYI